MSLFFKHLSCFLLNKQPRTLVSETWHGVLVAFCSFFCPLSLLLYFESHLSVCSSVFLLPSCVFLVLVRVSAHLFSLPSSLWAQSVCLCQVVFFLFRSGIICCFSYTLVQASCLTLGLNKGSFKITASYWSHELLTETHSASKTNQITWKPQSQLPDTCSPSSLIKETDTSLAANLDNNMNKTCLIVIYCAATPSVSLIVRDHLVVRPLRGKYVPVTYSSLFCELSPTADGILTARISPASF